MSDESLAIHSPHAQGRVYLTGALFTQAEFRLPSGRWVKPLAEAPWSANPHPDLAGHMQRLGGEFFCLPFGGGGTVHQPSPGWECLVQGAVDEPMHGPAANADWELIEHRSDRARLTLNYPRSSPIDRIERTIALASDAPRLDTTVFVHARRQARVAAAFHPILRLTVPPFTLEIDAEFELGLTYPGVLEPDRMACEPGHNFKALSNVPGRFGGTVDLRRLPLGRETEDVVMLAGMRGPLQAHFTGEGFAVRLDWNRALLPHCLLWIHDRGLDSEPWNGGYRGLGIEPAAAAFDGPWDFSAGSNPLNAVGFATSVLLNPDLPLEFRCSLSLSEM